MHNSCYDIKFAIHHQLNGAIYRWCNDETTQAFPFFNIQCNLTDTMGNILVELLIKKLFGKKFRNYASGTYLTFPLTLITPLIN